MKSEDYKKMLERTKVSFGKRNVYKNMKNALNDILETNNELIKYEYI